MAELCEQAKRVAAEFTTAKNMQSTPEKSAARSAENATETAGERFLELTGDSIHESLPDTDAVGAALKAETKGSRSSSLANTHKSQVGGMVAQRSLALKENRAPSAALLPLAFQKASSTTSKACRFLVIFCVEFK